MGDRNGGSAVYRRDVFACDSHSYRIHLASCLMRSHTHCCLNGARGGFYVNNYTFFYSFGCSFPNPPGDYLANVIHLSNKGTDFSSAYVQPDDDVIFR